MPNSSAPGLFGGAGRAAPASPPGWEYDGTKPEDVVLQVLLSISAVASFCGSLFVLHQIRQRESAAAGPERAFGQRLGAPNLPPSRSPHHALPTPTRWADLPLTRAPHRAGVRAGHTLVASDPWIAMLAVLDLFVSFSMGLGRAFIPSAGERPGGWCVAQGC